MARVESSSEESASRVHPLLLVFLKVVINGGHGEENTGPAADGSQEVGKGGEESNAESAKGRCGGNVPIELLLQGGLSVALDENLLGFQVLGDVARARSADFDPSVSSPTEAASPDPR